MSPRLSALLCALALLLPGQALAKKKHGKKKKVTVPVDIGIGPAAHMLTGPLQQDQRFHLGLVLSVQAIVDKKTLKKFKKRIPRQYRQQVLAMDELRISPSIFIPDTLWVSPRLENTGIYGISWTPLNLGLPLVRAPFRWDVGASLRVSYAFLHSDGIQGVEGGQPFAMHFLRPGLDLGTELEIPFSDSFLVSGGWRSQLYVPQQVGGGLLGVGPIQECLWHIGQPFLMLHVRFPYEVAL